MAECEERLKEEECIRGRPARVGENKQKRCYFQELHVKEMQIARLDKDVNYIVVGSLVNRASYYDLLEVSASRFPELVFRIGNKREYFG